MSARISIICFGLATICAFGPATAVTASANPADRLTSAEIFAAVAGKVVGAASACQDISADRVSAAATKASIVSSLAANDNADVASAQKLFAENDDYGRALVRSGRANCDEVSISLASLEKAEAP